MCTYSMIADHYRDKFTAPFFSPNFWPSGPPAPMTEGIPVLNPHITRAEFDLLRRDVEEMKDLLKRAKKYDADNGEPDCEMDEKVALIKRIAELVGIDLGDALPSPPA